jgi:phosphoserine phosphatase
VAAPKLVFLDCDSTLSAIEGIDELARLRGPDVYRQVENMTRQAMDGRLPLGEIFARRLDLIWPHRRDLDAVGRLYLEQVEPTARETVAALRAAGWITIIISGGFRPAIAPLAEFLGVDRLEAVELYFDDAGDFAGFDGDSPLTRSGGKPERIAELKSQLQPSHTVMVGDGASDLEAKPAVDLFVGYGGFVAREKVRAGAEVFIHRLAELPPLLTRVD